MLTYDLTGTEDAMTGVKGNVSAIVPYVQAVLDLSLGPQPIVIGGQQAGLWDPFAQTPGLVSSLQGIKQHCQDFHDNVLIGLANVPGFLVIFGGNTNYRTYGIQCDLAQILSVLQALQQSKAPPTAAQRQAVGSALDDLSFGLNMIASMMNVLPDSTATFVDQISGDVQTLTDGSCSINSAINQANQSYQSAVEQYILGPGGGVIAKILGDIFGQIVSGLQAIQGQLNGAVAAAQPVPEALSKLQRIFTVLISDYLTTSQAITAASDAQFASVVQELDVQNAQSYWQNATTFAIANGLGYSGGVS